MNFICSDLCGSVCVTDICLPSESTGDIAFMPFSKITLKIEVTIGRIEEISVSHGQMCLVKKNLRYGFKSKFPFSIVIYEVNNSLLQFPFSIVIYEVNNSLLQVNEIENENEISKVEINVNDSHSLSDEPNFSEIDDLTQPQNHLVDENLSSNPSMPPTHWLRGHEPIGIANKNYTCHMNAILQVQLIFI